QDTLPRHHRHLSQDQSSRRSTETAAEVEEEVGIIKSVDVRRFRREISLRFLISTGGDSMHNIPSMRLSWIRLISLVLLPAALLAAASWLAAQPKEEQEEPAPKKPKKLPKDEVEDPTPPRSKPPLRVPDDEPSTASKSRPKPADAPVADLAEEAKKAQNDDVKRLYESVATPHDAFGRVLYVVPLSEYLKKPFPETLEVQQYDLTKRPWRIKEPGKIKTRNLGDFTPYEQLALNAVDTFVKNAKKKDPGDKGFLSSVEMLRVAETVLIAVKSWHSSARERGLRSGEGWADVEKKLDDALLRAQLDRVQALAAAKLWGDAFKLANDLADTHVDNKEVQRVTNLLRVQESLLALQNNPTPDF